MVVVFLGYAQYNFDSRDGAHVDGVKFFYYFQSRKANYFGFETNGLFVRNDPSNKNLIDSIKRCVPGEPYKLMMEYDGKYANLVGIVPTEKTK